MLENMELCIGGFSSGFSRLKIWTENGKMLKAYDGTFTDLSVKYPQEVSEAEQKKIEDIFVKFNISGWKKEYEDPCILDGTQWHLQYKEQGKKSRRIYGSNKYPDNWNAFIAAMGTIASGIAK